MRAALDIGGTKIAVGLVDGTRVICHVTIPTLVEMGPLAAIERIGEALEKLLHSHHRTGVEGAGVACAGPVNSRSGRIDNPHTLPGWDQIAFTDELAKRLGVPVCIEHDVGTTLLGCIRLHGLQTQRVVLAMFGTGVGLSVACNGEIYQNGTAYHPEFGSLQLRPEGDPCFCGRKGCVDNLLSGTALNRRAQAIGLADFSALTASKSERAEMLKTAVHEELAMLANNLAVIFQPSVFCFGGGITSANPKFFETALSSVFQKAYAFVGPCEVRRVDDRQAALVGAALLCDRFLAVDRKKS
jgi:glucokinase